MCTNTENPERQPPKQHLCCVRTTDKDCDFSYFAMWSMFWSFPLTHLRSRNNYFKFCCYVLVVFDCFSYYSNCKFTLFREFWKPWVLAILTWSQAVQSRLIDFSCSLLQVSALKHFFLDLLLYFPCWLTDNMNITLAWSEWTRRLKLLFFFSFPATHISTHQWSLTTQVGRGGEITWRNSTRSVPSPLLKFVFLLFLVWWRLFNF